MPLSEGEEGEFLCGRTNRGLKQRLIKSTSECVAELVWMQFACLGGAAGRVASPGDKPHCLDLTVQPSSAWADFSFTPVAALCFAVGLCGNIFVWGMFEGHLSRAGGAL